jgi:hypothetical protein
MENQEITIFIKMELQYLSDNSLLIKKNLSSKHIQFIQYKQCHIAGNGVAHYSTTLQPSSNIETVLWCFTLIAKVTITPTVMLQWVGTMLGKDGQALLCNSVPRSKAACTQRRHIQAKKPAATPNAFHVNATTNYWIHIFFHSTKSKARFSHVPIWVFPRHLPAAYESLKVLLRPQRVVAPCWSKTSSWTWPGFELVAALPAAATNPDAEREWSTSVIRWPRWCFHNLSALWNSARWNCADVVN